MIEAWLRRVAFALHTRILKLADEHAREALRTRLGHLGEGCTLGADLHVSAPERVWLGDNVHIGRRAWIRAEGGLHVGSNTHISRNVTIYTTNHDYAGARLPYDDNMVEKPVVIGENVWIGMNVSIAPGTRIGEGAILALGACVSGEVPPLAIVGHQKYRILGYRDPVHYTELCQRRAFGGPGGTPFIKSAGLAGQDANAIAATLQASPTQFPQQTEFSHP